VVYLKRPGKKEPGLSASWNHIPNRFYVFSSNTPFENGHIYKASAVYAILEHAGNFSAAAAALLEKGFGILEDKKKSVIVPGQPEPEKIKPLSIYRVSDFKSNIDRLRRDGLPKGFSTGLPGLDKFYRIARGQLNIVTGIPSHGKSEVMDAIMVNMAKEHDWRFVVFSPENYPLEFHFQKLAEKYIDKHFLNFTDRDYDSAISFFDKHFFFIPATEDGINIENLLLTVGTLLENEKIDGLLLDPWNDIEADANAFENETLYIGRSLSTTRRFSRKHNIATWIVAHPTKLRKEKNQEGIWEYPIPDLYTISGSANWYNKADNGIVVWRDFTKDVTKVIVQKIKFKYYGGLGEVVLKYQPGSGNYLADDGGF
jgi:twinkle protein